MNTVSYTHLRAHETRSNLVCRLLLEKKKEAGGQIFGYLLFPIACFLYTLLPSPRDTLELLGHGMLYKLD